MVNFCLCLFIFCILCLCIYVIVRNKYVKLDMSFIYLPFTSSTEKLQKKIIWRPPWILNLKFRPAYTKGCRPLV